MDAQGIRLDVCEEQHALCPLVRKINAASFPAKEREAAKYPCLAAYRAACAHETIVGTASKESLINSAAHLHTSALSSRRRQILDVAPLRLRFVSSIDTAHLCKSGRPRFISASLKDANQSQGADPLPVARRSDGDRRSGSSPGSSSSLLCAFPGFPSDVSCRFAR